VADPAFGAGVLLDEPWNPAHVRRPGGGRDPALRGMATVQTPTASRSRSAAGSP